MRFTDLSDRALSSTLYPHATIHFPCEIGDDTKIWRYVHVGRGAVVGSTCVIGEGVHVGPNVKIGNGCKIQNGAQLFDGVTLEENVFIGPHVVFSNVLTPRAFVKRADAFSPTLVKRGASIGANATIICGVTIGEYAMIGAGSVVTRDVAAYTVVYGNPARARRAACACGEILARAVVGSSTEDAHLTCRRCSAEYLYSFALGIRAKTSP